MWLDNLLICFPSSSECLMFTIWELARFCPSWSGQARKKNCTIRYLYFSYVFGQVQWYFTCITAIDDWWCCTLFCVKFCIPFGRQEYLRTYYKKIYMPFNFTLRVKWGKVPWNRVSEISTEIIIAHNLYERGVYFSLCFWCAVNNRLILHWSETQ